MDGPVSRFRAGMANATIVIAPVSGTVSANPSRINCGQQTQLSWASTETVDANMSGFSPVPVQGDRTVSPKQTTEYVFTATGPGGVVNTKTAVEVNTDVAAQLQASPAEVHYRRVGDKVIQQDPISLSWTTSNADAASLSAVGTVENSGTRSITPVPTQATEGAVDETINYTLSATNTCGGSTTKTASVHLTGSMESVPGVTLQSVFYPTAYPTETDPGDGLLNSQRQMLTTLAAGFTKYLEYDPDAKISLEAHADPRGGEDYNQALSLRRANLVKDFSCHRESRRRKSTLQRRERKVRSQTTKSPIWSPRIPIQRRTLSPKTWSYAPGLSAAGGYCAGSCKAGFNRDTSPIARPIHKLFGSGRCPRPAWSKRTNDDPLFVSPGKLPVTGLHGVKVRYGWM